MTKPAARIDPILGPRLIPSMASLSIYLNRTEFCVSFIQHLKALQPISSQMAQQMQPGYQHNCLSDSAAICNPYQQFSQQTEYPTEAPRILLKFNCRYKREDSWEVDKHFSMELMSTFTCFLCMVTQITTYRVGKNLSLAH